MAALARIDLERLLESRKLGTTVPQLQPDSAAPPRLAATDLPQVDEPLGGGWPRGHISELVGPVSAGASWIACCSMAAATRRGELAALIDPLDMFDPESAATAGFVWSRLLWVRVGDSHGPARTPWRVVIERALKGLALVLQTEGFGVIVLDLQNVPRTALTHLPFTTWRRIQRLLAGRDVVCLVVHSEPVARSAGGVSLVLESARGGGHARWSSRSPQACRFTGLSAHARIVRARWQAAPLDGFEL